jgi:methylmalonyl-CoA mutase
MAIATEKKTTSAAQQTRPIRMVTATSLFDGHDAAINVMRRVMVDCGAEVIHLGHNRSARGIVQAAVQEDADAIAVSSYQGGHMEFFTYILSLLREAGAGHIQVFGGGGGVIVPKEIAELHERGVARIYSPEDGRRLGLTGMIEDMLARITKHRMEIDPACSYDLADTAQLARQITALDIAKHAGTADLDTLLKRLPNAQKHAPVLGVTGTGGAGKSSLVDELVTRFLDDFADKRVAVLSVDPTKQRTGGALLGDRIRMNTASHPRVFMRSLATRGKSGELSDVLAESIAVAQAAGFDFIIAETAGIGQNDAGIVPLVDVSLYVMTADYGAASQLEKIGMLDFADLVAINKFDHRNAEDALRDVRKQYQRNRQRFEDAPDAMPVYGTIAARFNDEGVTALYHGLIDTMNARCDCGFASTLPRPATTFSTSRAVIVPPDRMRYLADIADAVDRYHAWAEEQAFVARDRWQLLGAADQLDDVDVQTALRARAAELAKRLEPRCNEALDAFANMRAQYTAAELVYTVRGKEVRQPMYRESLSGTRVPRVALPNYEDPGALLRWLLRENLPGYFPFTAGCFPLKRDDEDPTRMFAGEGDAERTNTRFKYLSAGAEAKRLSTAFDSVTLYGWDPQERLDIYGKVGTSGVSIATLDDMKTLYDGFDLAAANVSVSMTINGPAPIILAMFFNTAIDQRLEKYAREHGQAPAPEEAARIRAEVLRQVRGTVQADILKEDQGQNTCIFAIDFALKMMADVQEFFIHNDVRNFYSVSISGYHIAEAGANPITQCAFTLANGFTYVEYYLARGMDISEFAPNLSFFFSCGMDPEYAVLNRVARRIWAVAMRERYGADERAQKLKAHIQTSGRSLHAQEVQFNDIRTTLQALTALYDQCNSLHTNAYDEAVTTPTEESVRRAVAIQLIINKEHGLACNENPLQGSFIIEELTNLVEEAVLAELRRISERGGVLRAMERGYQRSKIQGESLLYEHRKASGELPLVGVNTFTNPHADHESDMDKLELRRGTEEEKQRAVQRVRAFQQRNADEAPEAIARLKQVCLENGNIFAELMNTVRTCSLGQISKAFFEAGGQYRRNM